MTEESVPAVSELKAHLGAADNIVDALPWQLGDTEAQRKRARGRVAALAHQIAGLAGGWTTDEIRAALAASPGRGGRPGSGRTGETVADGTQADPARQAQRPPWQPDPGVHQDPV